MEQKGRGRECEGACWCAAWPLPFRLPSAHLVKATLLSNAPTPAAVLGCVPMNSTHTRYARLHAQVDSILTDFKFHERDAFLACYPHGLHKVDRQVRVRVWVWV